MALEVNSRRKGDSGRWIPKIALVSTFIFGLIVWTVWAYVEQSQLFWIPEATFWYRLGVLMVRNWYIPSIFVAVGFVSFILLRRKYSKSE